jgi:hypothetical protein
MIREALGLAKMKTPLLRGVFYRYVRFGILGCPGASASHITLLIVVGPGTVPGVVPG